MNEKKAALTIGKNLRRLRGRAKMVDVALVSGVSRMTLHNFETGAVLPSTRILLRLAEALDTTLTELVAGL